MRNEKTEDAVCGLLVAVDGISGSICFMLPARQRPPPCRWCSPRPGASAREPQLPLPFSGASVGERPKKGNKDAQDGQDKNQETTLVVKTILSILYILVRYAVLCAFARTKPLPITELRRKRRFYTTTPISVVAFPLWSYRGFLDFPAAENRVDDPIDVERASDVRPTVTHKNADALHASTLRRP